jgi:myo-inositol 2-dehydrogenase / D-chiro-inositol 1-dehydrogenase
MLRLGILGCGRIGRVHAQSARRNARCVVTRVSDVDARTAQGLAEEIGAQPSEADKVISAPDIDAVILASPTDPHADYIEAAAKAGKAILCESPSIFPPGGSPVVWRPSPRPARL